MSFFFKRVPWSSKPDSPVGIDWSHPSAKDIEGFWIVLSGRVYDVVGKHASNTVLNSGSTVYKISEFSKERSLTSLGVDDYINTDYEGPQGSNQRSFIGSVRMGLTTASITNANGTIVGYGDSAGTNYARWNFRLNEDSGVGTDAALRLEMTGGYVIANTAIDSVDSKNGQHIVGYSFGDTGATLSDSRIYLDGKVDGESGDWSGDNGSGTVNTDNDEPFTICRSNTSGTERNWSGQISYGITWSRALSDEEHRSIADNPYQLLQPRSIPIYLPEAAATTGAFFRKRIPWTSKPDYPVGVDWSNPLTKGLDICILFNDGTNAPRELVNNVLPTTVGANNTATVGAKGRQLSCGSTPQTVYPIAGTDNCTQIAMVNIGASSIETISDSSDATMNGSLQFRVSASQKLDLVDGGQELIGSSTTAFSLNTWHLVAASYDGDSVGNYKFYLDGQPDGSGNNTTSIALNNFQLFTRGTGGSSSEDFANSDIALFLRYNRILSDAEHAAIYENPYQLLQPRTIPIYIEAAAAGGDTEISTTTDTLVISPKTATVNAETSITSIADTLSISTKTATVNVDINITATTDTLVIAPKTAVVNAETAITTIADTLSISAKAAIVNAATAITTIADTLVIATKKATVTVGNDISITTIADTLSISAKAAIVNAATDITTTADTLSISPKASVVSLNTNVTAIVQNLTLAEQAAAIALNLNIVSITDALVISPKTATVLVEGDRLIEGSATHVISTDFGEVMLYQGTSDGNYYTI